MRCGWFKRTGDFGLCLLFTLLFRGFSPAAETVPLITASLDKDRVRVGEEAALSIEVTWEGDASALEFLLPDRPDCRLVAVIGSAQKSLVCRAGGRLRQFRQYIFKLRGEEKGEGRVGGVRVLYRRRGEEGEHSLESKPLVITVTSGLGSALPVFRKAFPVIAIGIPLAAATVGYTWIAKRRRRKSGEISSDYVKNPEDESVKELGLARKLRVEGDMEGYFDRIRQVLAGYLGKKYSLKISDGDWEGQLEKLNGSVLKGENREQLKEIFKTLELSRFGNYPAEGRELDAILKKLTLFFRSQRG